MVQHVKFNYPDGTLIYKDLDFGIDLDSRIALVGPNGAGLILCRQAVTCVTQPQVSRR